MCIAIYQRMDKDIGNRPISGRKNWQEKAHAHEQVLMRNICILQNYFFPTPKHALKIMKYKGNSEPQLAHKLTWIFTKSLKQKENLPMGGN